MRREDEIVHFIATAMPDDYVFFEAYLAKCLSEARSAMRNSDGEDPLISSRKTLRSRWRAAQRQVRTSGSP